MLDLIIIGAGPYGISLAAHAKAKGLTCKLLGKPMHFWKRQMPQSMFIRTHPDSIQLSDERVEYTLPRFCEETGAELAIPLPRPVFVDYAFWFAAKTGVEFTPETVVRLDSEAGGYDAVTETGQRYRAKNAIVATGLQHYAHIPDVLAGISSSLVSHTFGYTDFQPFAGKKVAVLGSGQSAWEAAALLHRAGSDTELIYRRETPNYREAVTTGKELIDLASAFYDLPPDKKRERRSQPPGSVAHFLRPYVEGNVRETGNVSIESAEVDAAGKLLLRLSNGERRVVDHLIAATGYRIDLDRVPFISRELSSRIPREDESGGGFPKLGAHFESGLPGLYFAGPLASYSHGPAFRFIAGLHKTCNTIMEHICLHPV
ncbi:lysine N(6)-hydroxylase/L-ornithine N(5)-oxygenase family protein [Paenibacillus hemerocallicola]|uniref:Lysine N(6)-hydroxylase/L-ornithine N(5)-oxygenase family protein n=1 Tax=Paenibacillus hemerocallicola TaxID=1172614 RepID=A0A5C4SVZ9_9BACL|nr:NAD(P)-binding domain-containing protein [Paenibacillus hemerocallicola]TNJ57724.1 lysine N(6)-hydroxylase/L-ornithine N(5)-oxygenase family protein [Paenibacillus hemerocallicola]